MSAAQSSRHQLHAPAVHFLLRRSASLGAVLAAFSAFGLMVLLLWASNGASSDAATRLMKLSLGLALWSLASAAAAYWWWTSPVGQLAWDGSRWELQVSSKKPHIVSAPRVHLDLQSMVLVEVRIGESSKGVWLWLVREAAPRHWDALRRAVYFHAPSDVPLSGGSVH